MSSSRRLDNHLVRRFPPAKANALMSLAVALLTVLMSGVVAAVVTYRLNATKEHVFFMRKKAEELYLAFDSFDRNLTVHFATAFQAIKSEISWHDFNDLIIKRADKRADKSDRDASMQVLMLVDIYFPGVKPQFENFSAQRAALNRIVEDVQRSNKAGEVAQETIKKFQRTIADFDAATKELKSKIIEEARKFSIPSQLWPRKSFVP